MASRKKTPKKDVTERIHVRIPVELATELRLRCARERKSLAKGIENAVRAWVT